MQATHPGRPVPLGPLRRAESATRQSCARSWRRPPSRRRTRDATTKKIGDYYAACMDEAAIDAHRPRPAQAASSTASRRSRRSATSPPRSPSCTGSACDRSSASAPARTSRTPRRSSRKSTRAASGLPDRDYYLKDDAKSVEASAQKYVAHVEHMFELLGDEPARRKADAADDDADRDRAGQRLARPRRPPRPREDLSQDDARGADSARARPSTGPSIWPASARPRSRAQRRRARLLQGPGRESRPTSLDDLEDLPALAPAARRAPASCPRPSSTRTSISTARR